MIRHEFSYWLTVKGDQTRLIPAAIRVRELAEDYLLPDYDGDSATDELHFCVDPDVGTIEEWPNAEETVGKLAAEFPDLAISLMCVDEENAVNSHNHVWYHGKNANAYARLILPDTDELMAEIADPESYTAYDEAFDALGWSVSEDGDSGSLELSKFSPAGEDFSFEIEGCDIPAEVREYADAFDVDEHVDLWAPGRGENGVPSSYRTLVEDAEAIQSMLDELADALESVQTNCELGTYDCATCSIHGCCDRDEEDNDDPWEGLKAALFEAGHDALEDFLGYVLSPDEDKDAIENRLDQVYMQMPEDELDRYFTKYMTSEN